MAGRAVLSVHTKKETSERLDRLAEARQQKKSALANQAIEEFLAKEEQIELQIREGMADVADGKVVSHEEVADWAASLGTQDQKQLPQA